MCRLAALVSLPTLDDLVAGIKFQGQAVDVHVFVRVHLLAVEVLEHERVTGFLNQNPRVFCAPIILWQARL